MAAGSIAPIAPIAPIALMLALAWGLNWPAIKIVLAEVPPFALRCLGLGGAAVLLMIVAALQRRRLVPPRESWAGILVAGALTVVAFNFCTAFAQLNTSTSRAAVLTYTMPTIAAVLAWALLGERPGRRGALAVVLGALGILVLAWPALRAAVGLQAGMPGGLSAGVTGGVLPGIPSEISAGISLKGPAFALGAALAWAGGTIVTKYLPPVQDRVVATAWQLALGGACAAVATLVSGETWPRTLSWTVGAALGYHIVIAMAFAYVLWYRLLDSASATVSSLTALAVPVVGVLGAMALVGDRPSGLDWVGFALVLGAAGLVLLRPLSSKSPPPARLS